MIGQGVRRAYGFSMNEIDLKLKEVMDEFECQTGTLHRAEDKWLHLVSCAGIPEVLLEKISKIPFGKGIAGVAAETKRPVELCNLQQDLEGVAKEDARKTGVSGSLAVAITDSSGNVLGTVGVGKIVPYDFTKEEKQRLIELGEEFIRFIE